MSSYLAHSLCPELSPAQEGYCDRTDTGSNITTSGAWYIKTNLNYHDKAKHSVFSNPGPVRATVTATLCMSLAEHLILQSGGLQPPTLLTTVAWAKPVPGYARTVPRHRPRGSVAALTCRKPLRVCCRIFKA